LNYLTFAQFERERGGGDGGQQGGERREERGDKAYYLSFPFKILYKKMSQERRSIN
jgi:hypothetical protein